MATIVLAEDDEPLRAALTLCLEQAGHEVTPLADGAGALAAVEQAPPDVLITDLSMPRMDGMELLSTLRIRGSSPPIIVISGIGAVPTDALFRTARALGASATIAKPFAALDLLRAVDEVLGEEGDSGGRPRE